MFAFGIVQETQRHIDGEEAERYVMGTSPFTEVAGLEEHLLVCARCRARIVDTDRYSFSMTDSAAEFRPQAWVRIAAAWRRWGWLALIAAVIGALLLGILALWHTSAR